MNASSILHLQNESRQIWWQDINACLLKREQSEEESRITNQRGKKEAVSVPLHFFGRNNHICWVTQVAAVAAGSWRAILGWQLQWLMWEVTLKRFLKNYINTLIVTSRQGEKNHPWCWATAHCCSARHSDGRFFWGLKKTTNTLCQCCTTASNNIFMWNIFRYR